MTRWLLSAALILSAFASSAIAGSKDALVGTWKLVSLKNTNDKGELVADPNATGFLIYTADGRFSAMSWDAARATTLPQSIEEKAKAFETFFAYAGTYTLSGDQVIHHIEAASVQILAGTDQVRSVKLEGNRLTLRGGFSASGVMSAANSELVWERMNPKTADK